MVWKYSNQYQTNKRYSKQDWLRYEQDRKKQCISLSSWKLELLLDSCESKESKEHHLTLPDTAVGVPRSYSLIVKLFWLPMISKNIKKWVYHELALTFASAWYIHGNKLSVCSSQHASFLLFKFDKMVTNWAWISTQIYIRVSHG